MPPIEFPGGFSWGYIPSHPFALESDYGGVQAFKEFVKAAHAHGLAVILDVVYNHLGPSDLDLWQFDGWSENEKGGIYFYNDHRAQTPWGHTRPDFGRGEVRQYLRDNAIMWLKECRVDGLRFDATIYIRSIHGNAAGSPNDPGNELPDGWSLLQWINADIQRVFPWKITIAEDFGNNAWISKDVGAGGAGFGAQWDPNFVHPVRQAIITPDDHARDLNALQAALLYRYDGDVFERVIYTESHDEVANGKARVAEEIWPGKVGDWFSKKRSTLGAGLVLTAPGIPMIFQGQEFLEDRWFHDQDPLEWSRTEKYRGLVDLYSRLIDLRLDRESNTLGLCSQNTAVHHLNHGDKVLAFHRWDQGGPGDSVIVVANLANKAYPSYRLGFPSGGVWKARFNSDWSGYDPGFGNHPSPDVNASLDGWDGMPCSAEISIGPYSMVIFSQDPQTSQRS
jgi:1,4-alpha-glucan branching enzyme